MNDRFASTLALVIGIQLGLFGLALSLVFINLMIGMRADPTYESTVVGMIAGYGIFNVVFMFVAVPGYIAWKLRRRALSKESSLYYRVPRWRMDAKAMARTFCLVIWPMTIAIVLTYAEALWLSPYVMCQSDTIYYLACTLSALIPTLGLALSLRVMRYCIVKYATWEVPKNE